MKLTWREQTDGSWHARHYPRGAEWLSPLTLSVWREDSVFPWHWEIRRHGEVLKNGQATEEEAARRAAHGQLMQLFPARTSGSLRGKLRTADDWDSDEVNAEIARDFGTDTDHAGT